MAEEFIDTCCGCGKRGTQSEIYKRHSSPFGGLCVLSARLEDQDKAEREASVKKKPKKKSTK